MLRIFPFLLGVLVGAGGFYFLVASSGSTYTPPKSASAGLAPKLLSIAFAQDKASRTNRPVGVQETFTDDEMSLMANEYLRQQDALPLDHLALHSTSRGVLTGKASAHVSALTAGVNLTLRPRVTDRHQVALTVEQVSIAGIPIPDPIAAALTRTLAGSDLALPLGNIQNVVVNTGDGSLTLSGTASP